MSQSDQKRILLVDGHSIANRAFFGLPPMTNTQGLHTNAVLGFFNILFKTIDDEKPEYLAVAFDLSTPTFRHKQFAEYKGTRKPMDPALKEQIPMIREMLEKAGVSIITKEGFEADDVLGTLGKTFGKQGNKVVILSGDRDLLQLVDNEITVRLPKTKKNGTEVEIYHPKEVKEKYGVEPAGFLQMKALMGDASDNIPGIPGIGEKTAQKIVQTYHTLENAIENASEVKPPRAGKNLSEYAEQGRLSLELATIKTDVADLKSPGELTKETFHTSAFIEKLKELELRSLINRLSKEEGSSAASEKAMTAQAATQTQQLLIAKTKEELEAFLNPPPKKLSIDFCTDEENGPILAAALTREDRSCYTEISEKELIQALAPVLSSPETQKAVFDVKSLCRRLSSYNIEIQGEVLDEMLAHYLLNATLGHYSVEGIGAAFTGNYMKTEEEILGTGVKRISWMLADETERRDHFIQRARILYEAEEPLLKQLSEEEMMPLYRDVEYPLAKVLSSMEQIGIKVDPAVLEELGVFLRGEIAKLQQTIYALAGEEFNINSPKQLGVILFDKLKFPAGKKTKSGYSTSADELEKLKLYPDAKPIIEAILSYRQLSKLESTYVEGLYPFIQKDGRIHCCFKQAVTATGRLSSTEPNLQNIPIRENLGRQLRKAFVAENKDWLFMDADYSQIELRLVAHMSGDENMIRAYNTGADIHRLTASQVLHIPYEEVTPKQRSSAKAVNFGIIYGISAFSLSEDLGISRFEAARYIENYFERFPKVKEFLDSCVEKAKETGYATTMFGRRRAIEELKAGKFALRSFGERVAKNMPIQGTAADIIKIAMVKVDRRLRNEGLKSRMLLQVHDELLLEVYRPEKETVCRILKEEMEGAAKLSLPLTVDVETGENWYDAK